MDASISARTSHKTRRPYTKTGGVDASDNGFLLENRARTHAAIKLVRVDSASARSVLLRCVRSCGQLVHDTRNKISYGEYLLLLPRPAHAQGERITLGFALSYDGHVRNLEGLGLAYSIIQRLGPIVEMHAGATNLEALDNRLGSVTRLIRDRNHSHLLRSEPQRKCSGVMLDESADESLHRSHQNAMQHHRPMRSVVRTGVLELEALWKIEIELHGRALPFAPDRVNELEVQLRSVERPAANVHLVSLPPLRHHLGQRALGFLPQLRPSKSFVRSRCKLDRVRITKCAKHLVDEVEKSPDLRRNLLRRAEHVRIVLRESANSQHSVQHTTSLVPVHRAKLGVSDRQIPIRTRLRLINADVSGAVHGLRPVRCALDIHRAEHVLLEILQVP